MVPVSITIWVCLTPVDMRNYADHRIMWSVMPPLYVEASGRRPSDGSGALVVGIIRGRRGSREAERSVDTASGRPASAQFLIERAP